MLTVEPEEVQTEQNYIEKNASAFTLDYIILAAITLVILVFLALQIYKWIRILRKRGRDRWSGYPNETYEMLPVKEGKRRGEKPKKRSSDPRERIRYLYGEFLRYLHKRQVQFGRTNTCGEIQHDAEKLSVANPSVLSEFTVIHEEARYCMKEMPTEADERNMKDLLDRIKKDLKRLDSAVSNEFRDCAFLKP